MCICWFIIFNSLIRVFEKALVKRVVKKFPEGLQEQNRFWIISWSRWIHFTFPYAVWHSVSYVLSSGQKPTCHACTKLQVQSHCVMLSFAVNIKLSVSQNFLNDVKVFFLIMVSFISLDFVLIQFLLLRQERGTYNRKVRPMKLF
jgi:hypothetical protein